MTVGWTVERGEGFKAHVSPRDGPFAFGKKSDRIGAPHDLAIGHFERVGARDLRQVRAGEVDAGEYVVAGSVHENAGEWR